MGGQPSSLKYFNKNVDISNGFQRSMTVSIASGNTAFKTNADNTQLIEIATGKIVWEGEY